MYIGLLLVIINDVSIW